MLLRPAGNNSAFPATPLQYRSIRKLRRDFDITVLSIGQGPDEPYHLGFAPKDGSGAFFRGELRVDRATATVRSLDLECLHCTRHPFQPLGQEDELREVDLQYRQSFGRWQGRPVLNTVEIGYAFTYHTGARSARLAEQDPGFRNDWRFQTKGILHLFAPGESFILPLFGNDAGQTDYRKVLSMPYDSAFWANAPSLVRTLRQQQDQALFAKQGLLLGNDRQWGDTDTARRGFFKGNNAFWSPQLRVRMKSVLDSTAYAPPSGKHEVATATANQLRLVARLYLNIDRTEQGYRTFSATVLDGFNSWCHLPDQRPTDVLLNIYFDLCEMERRRMQVALDRPGLSLERIHTIHAAAERAIDQATGTFLRDVRYGADNRALGRWNARVRDALGVDNFLLFGIHPGPE
ncbi:MAG: hypothetical protein KBH07_12875 [Flavobacteriales bacterium]|nr:hypothetical protein [Flavobacteriales bacterium]